MELIKKNGQKWIYDEEKDRMRLKKSFGKRLFELWIGFWFIVLSVIAGLFIEIRDFFKRK